MLVVLLLAVVWAAVLIPPAVRAQRSRREAFAISFGRTPTAVRAPAEVPSRHSPAVQRRRVIAGGLLVAMVVTGLISAVATMRALLAVHLFLVDSFLFYVALLAFRADRLGRPSAADRSLERSRPLPTTRRDEAAPLLGALVS